MQSPKKVFVAIASYLVLVVAIWFVSGCGEQSIPTETHSQDTDSHSSLAPSMFGPQGYCVDQNALGQYAIEYQNGNDTLVVGHMYTNKTMDGISFDMYVDAKRVAGPLDLVVISIIGIIWTGKEEMPQEFCYSFPNVSFAAETVREDATWKVEQYTAQFLWEVVKSVPKSTVWLDIDRIEIAANTPNGETYKALVNQHLKLFGKGVSPHE